MEPEGLLPCSHEPSTGPYREPDRSSQYQAILSKIRFNIVTCMGYVTNNCAFRITRLD
jgi:hypothetical protein